MMRHSSDSQLDRGSWIAMTLVAAAAVVYLVFFFVPKMRAISTSLAQLESKVTYILLAQKSGRATVQIEDELANVLAYVDKHDEQLLTQQQLPTLFSQISQISKSNNVITTKFEPRPAVPYESLRSVSLSMGVSGSFPSIFGVVRDLEALPTRVWIEDMRIQAPKKDGEAVECDMLLVVFIDNPEKTD